MSTRTAVRLKDVTTYVNRGVAPSYVDEPTEWIAFNQKCVRPDGSIAAELGRPMSDPGPAGRTAVLRAGDVCVNSTGRGTLGRAGFVDAETAGSQALVADGHVTVLRSDPASLEPRYLWYLLGNDRFYEYANTCLAVGSTNQTELGRDALRTLPLQLPDLQEQRRIVDYLDTETARIDELTTEQELLSSLLDERDANALTDAVTGRAGWSGPWHTAGPWWLGPAPEHWAPHKVGTSFRVGSGTTPSSSNLDFYGGSHAWVTTGELRETVILETAKSVSDLALMEHSALRVWSPGAVVIAMYGATIGRVGRLGIQATVNQACCVLDDPTTVTSEFAYYWFQAFRSQIADLGRGGGQPNISQDTIRQLRIPAPSVDEQREIVQRIDESRAQSQAVRVELRHQIKLLQEHRQALITAAVTGGLDAVGRVA